MRFSASESLAVELGLPGAVAVEYVGPLAPAVTDSLFESERDHVKSATAKRQCEFAAGRAAARLAATELGIDLSAIGVGGKREPLWPAGVTGSITHTRDYVLAVIAELGDPARAIGVDAEHVTDLEPGVARRILTAPELDRIDSASNVDRSAEIIGIFSAKEAFYKAQFQLTAIWVGFQDVMAEPTELGYELHCVTDHEIGLKLDWPQQAYVVRKGPLVVAGISATLST